MGRCREMIGDPLSKIFLVIIVLVIFPFKVNASEAPLYPMDPEVWVEVENDEYDMDVEPGTSGMLHIRGWVHCEVAAAYPPGETVQVTVDIGGTNYYTNVFQYDFDKTTDVAEMNLDIAPILGASVEHEILMRFIPNWVILPTGRTGGGTEDQTVVHPLPYGSVHIRDPEKAIFGVGEKKRIDIIVENNGNSEAVIQMNIESVEGFEFTYPSLLFIIPERSFGVYPFFITQTSGSGKEGKLHIKATSSVPGVMASDEVDLEYETEGSIGQIITNPVFIVSLLVFIVVMIAATALLVRRRKRKKDLRSY
ncbi:MAG: hypothetical protein ACMUFK_05385 [Thermoplasmatota archaeon]